MVGASDGLVQAVELRNNVDQFLASGGERVFRSGRHFGIDLLGEHPIGSQFAEPLGQHFGGNACDVPFQCAGTCDASGHGLQDGDRPLTAHHVFELLIDVSHRGR